MFIERKFADTCIQFSSLVSMEGVLGEPVTLVKERAEMGFPSTSLSNDETSNKNTLLSPHSSLYPTSKTLSNSSYPYDDWELDLHKLKPTRPLDDFISKQKYEGIVLSVSDSSFVARLHNLSENVADEEAEFAIEELNEDDMSLLKEGAVFYWNIGYLICHGGYRIACHMINFRRLPIWSKKEIEEADERVESLLSWLSSGDD